jgi:hypothetical protein
MWEITVSRYRIQYPYIESVCDQGFKRRVHADTSIKNEDTWYRVLGHYDAKYDSALRSHVLRGVVARKALYTESPRSTGGTTSAT